MRIARNILIGFAALLTLTMVLLLTVDLGRFKGTTEDFVSSMLGRDFAIGGEFQVHLGRQIHIVAEDVKLADADWSSNDAFARVGRFEGTIDTWSLISSPIRVEKLRIDNVRVNLLSSESGQDNWDLFPADEADEEQPQERLTLPAILVDALVADLVLGYDAPQRPQPLTFKATEIRAVQTDADALQLDLSGDINETPLELVASAGVVANLVNFRDVDFDLSGRLGEIRFDGEAAVDDVLQPRRPTASLKLQGPNAEYLTSILRMQQLTTGPLDLVATIVPVGEKMQLMVNGIFGEFALDASGQFVDLQDLREVDLRIAASGPDSSAVGRLLGNDFVPADPFSVVGNLQRSGDRVSVEALKVTVGKSQFDVGGRFEQFPDPRSAQATIQIDGPDFGQFNRLLGLPGKLTGPFSLQGKLAPRVDGGATIDMTAVARDIHLSVAGDISDQADFVGTRLEVNSTGPDLRTVTTALGLEQGPAEPFEMALVAERVAEGVKIETGTLTLASDRFALTGLVGNEPMQAGTDVDFDVLVPDLARTLTAFGRDADELPSARFAASGRIERGTENFVLHDVAASIGNNREYLLNVEGWISPETDFVGSKVEVSASGKSLGALTDAAGIEGMPDLPFELRASVGRLAGGVSVEDGSARVGDDRVKLHGRIADKPLEGDTDVSFEAQSPDFKASLKRFGADIAELPPGPLDVQGEMRYQGKYFAVQKLQATLAGAKLNAVGRLGMFPELEGTKLTVQMNGTDLSRLLPDEQKFSALNKPFGLSAKVGVRNKDLSLDDVSAFVDEMRLTADIDLRMSPMLGGGKFSINATSPDLFRLTPRLAEISVSERAPLEFHADGKWVDDVWTLDDFSLQLGKGTLVAKGTVDGPPDFTRTDLRSTVNISSQRNLSMLAGRELPDEPAMLKMHLVGSDEVMTLKEFAGTFGESDISGEFTLRRGDKDNINFGLRSKRLNLAPYLPELTAENLPEKEPEEQKPKADRVIPDTVIPMDELRKYRVSANVDIAELNLRHRTLRDILAVGAVEGGALKLTNFNIKSSRDEVLTGKLNLRPVETGAELLLSIQGTALAMGLPAVSIEEMQKLPRYDVDTVLHGVGVTVRELAGSLDGYVRLVSGPGDIRTKALAFFTNDFLSEVFSTVNPFVKSDPYSHYKCVAILLRIDDGVVAGQPAAVVQTDRLRIFASGKVDLKTEKLNATINTVPTRGLGISFSDLINPYTMIGGTLASPSLILDPERALIEGGTAVATGGISILAKKFKDRFLSAKDACGEAVADADPDFQAVKESYYPLITEAN